MTRGKQSAEPGGGSDDENNSDHALDDVDADDSEDDRRHGDVGILDQIIASLKNDTGPAPAAAHRRHREDPKCNRTANHEASRR
jgi:hypothetical protein